jgi:hypothetical protein
MLKTILFCIAFLALLLLWFFVGLFEYKGATETFGLRPHPGVSAFQDIESVLITLVALASIAVACCVFWAIGKPLGEWYEKSRTSRPNKQISPNPSEPPELPVPPPLSTSDKPRILKASEMTDTKIMNAAEEIRFRPGKNNEQLDDFLEANGGSVLPEVWDFVYYGNLPEGPLSEDAYIKNAFGTYEKWKAEREIHLQAIRRAHNLKMIREACQQYEQWRQWYWGRPEGPIYNP